MATYFQYQFGVHLSRPSTVTGNTSYNGVFSILASPFNGETINLNFFNLAAFANDATIRLGILEAEAQLGYSTTKGYITYNARQEQEGAFYSGIPLVIAPSVSAISAPYTFAQPLAFQAAAGNGIILLSNATVDPINSTFKTFTFGVPGQVGPYASSSTLITYLNSKLLFNTLLSTNAFGFFGTANPYSVGSTVWNNTWGALSISAPKTFWIYINDQKTINAGTLVTLSSAIPYASSISTLATFINAAIQVAIGGIAPAVVVAPDASNTYVNLTQTTNDRSQGGCYEIRVERVSGDLNSPLDWLGWTTGTSSNFTETYDYTSLFTFVANSNTPFGVSIIGMNLNSTLTFKPQDSTGTVTDFLNAFALPTVPTIYYHTRLPLTTYLNKPLNYGGSLTVNNLTAMGNLVVNGSVTYAGTAVYTGILTASAFGFVSATYTPGLAAVLYPGNVVPSYVQTVRGNWNGPFSANIFVLPSSNSADVGYGTLAGGPFGATTNTLTFPAMPTNGTIIPQFATQQTGWFDNSASTPVHVAGRINYDGLLYATGVDVTTYLHAPQVTGHLTGGYATNPLFELNQAAGVLPTNWVLTMNTTPGTVPTPTSLTPGNINAGTSLKTNATNAIMGNYDAIFTKPAVNQQGVFMYQIVTIDRAMVGQYMKVSFEYLASTNYVAGDIGVFLYDVTGNTVITPTVSAVPVSPSTSVPGHFVTYFKPTANQNNITYWVILHQTNASAITADTFEFGGINVDQLGAIPAIKAEYICTGTAVPATTVQINFDTLVENSGGGVVTTGAGAWKYTAPLPGLYQVSAFVDSPTGTVTVVGTSFFALDLYKAGAVVSRLGGKRPDTTSSTIVSANGTGTVRVVTPSTDFIDVRTVYSVSSGTPLFNVTAPAQPRIQIVWLGF